MRLPTLLILLLITMEASSKQTQSWKYGQDENPLIFAAAGVEGSENLFFKVPVRPADIALDLNRNAVTAPNAALNRVDFWIIWE
mgnify:CR=1 FL=1